MATERCNELFRTFFDAMETSQGDAMAVHLTDDVRWWFPQSAEGVGGIGHFVDGREPVLAILGHADKYFKHLVYTFEHVVEDGDMVAVHAKARGETVAGRSYANEYHFLFRISDGFIAEGWEFLDTAYAYSRNQ
jgi:ketosteroid isomerase-like protein